MADQTRVVIYCRISKDRIGAGLGVDRQERLCRERAKKEGWTVLAVFTDNDLSAYSGKPRPGYRTMLAGLDRGDFPAVLVWHTDRLHRSPPELEEYIPICQERNIPTYAVKAGTLDLTTAWGRKEARNRATDARYESEHMSERIIEGLADLAAAGGYGGGPRPFGFERDGVTLRPAESDELAKGIREVIVTKSIAGLARRWNAEGIKPTRSDKWTAGALRPLLLRPRNAGLREYRGKVVGDAVWPAIVTVAEHLAIVAVLTDSSRRPPPSNSLKWQGSGAYLCGRCGADTPSTMRSNSVWAPKRKIIVPAYRCREVNHNTITAEHVDTYVNKVIAEVLRFRGKDLLLDHGPDNSVELYSELNALTGRRKQLAEMFGRGDIDATEWSIAGKEVKERTAELEIQLEHLASGSDLEGIADADDPGAAYLSKSPERRRQALRSIAVVLIHPPAPWAGKRKVGEVNPARVEIIPKNGGDGPLVAAQ